MKHIGKNWHWHVRLMLSEQVLARWWHPVASSEALDLLHLAMRAISYRRITMAIKTASFVGVFIDSCLFACCPGRRRGNMERVVAQCRRPVASGVALGMPTILLWHTAVVIETAGGQGAFVCHH
jgi:hypothetical protein